MHTLTQLSNVQPRPKPQAKRNFAEAQALGRGGKVGHISGEEIQEAQEQLRTAGRELAEVRGFVGGAFGMGMGRGRGRRPSLSL